MNESSEMAEAQTKYPATLVELRSRDGSLQLEARVDGCCHIRTYANGSTPDKLRVDSCGNERHDDVSYIHICDLGIFIEQLQVLKVAAIERFKHVSRSEWSPE